LQSRREEPGICYDGEDMKLALALSVLLAAVSQAAQTQKPPRPEGPKTEEQKVLYSLGIALGRNVAAFQLTPEELRFVKMGLEDSVRGKPPQVDLRTYGPKIDELARTRSAAKAKAQREKDKPFLEKAAREKGAQILPSGVVYAELKAGSGASPSAEDTVRAHYRGTLADGKVFDSSYERGQPMDFALNQVIPCWRDGVQKMKVGGKARLICPSEAAYGNVGSGPIPGGAALDFQIELIAIVKKP